MEAVADRTLGEAARMVNGGGSRPITIRVDMPRRYYSASSFDVALNVRRAMLSQATVAQVLQERLIQMTSMQTSVTTDERPSLLNSLQPLVGACLVGAVLAGFFAGGYANPEVVRLIGAGAAALAYLAWRLSK